MPYTPVTVALLRALRRRQGRPLRENAADIGIHRDHEPECTCNVDNGWPCDLHGFSGFTAVCG